MIDQATVRYKVEEVCAHNMYRQAIVVCTLVDGRRFQHSNDFSTIQQAQDLAARVAVKGTIDLAHWHEMAPKGGTPAASHLQAKARAEAVSLKAAPGMHLAA